MLLAVLVCFAACRPRGILSSRQMRNVLYDLHRTDAIIQVKGYSYNHDEEVARYYQVVLDKHNVTKAEFDSSLVWYTDHPQMFTRIYPKIMKRCQQEKEYWEEMENQKKGHVIITRDLPPIEDVMQTLQHGYDINLLPDSLREVPELEELLLPLGRTDSITESSSLSAATPTANSAAAETSAASAKPRDTSEDIIDGKTPMERRREEQYKRLQERLKLKPATEK